METKTTECQIMIPPTEFNLDSVLKLDIKWIEEEDGSGTIRIEWDEEDADLQWWTDLGEEKQKAFIINSLETAIEAAIKQEETNDVV